jgi:predicted phage tail protein
MTAALREVRLYGRLGAQFGRVFHLAVQSPGEAVRALCAVLPGFRAAFLGEDGRAEYHVFVGRGAQREAIDERRKDDLVGPAAPIRIVPAIAGAKRQGLGQTILGAVLMVAGVALGAYGSVTGNGFAYQAGVTLFNIGAAMVIGGVIQMLSPQRKTDESKNDPSYGLDAGAVNITDSGVPVPLAYGRVIAGSVQVSAGLSTDELVVGSTTTLDPLELPDYMPRFEVDSGAVASSKYVG